MEKIVDHLPRSDLWACLTVNRSFNIVARVRLYHFLDLFKHGALPVLDKSSDLLKMTNTLRVFSHSEEDCKHIAWADLKYHLFPGQTVVYFKDDEVEWYRLGVVKSPGPVATPSPAPAPTGVTSGLLSGVRNVVNRLLGSASASKTPSVQHPGTTDEEVAASSNLHICGALGDLHTDTVIYRPLNLTMDSRPSFTLDVNVFNDGPNCHQVFQVILPHHIPRDLRDNFSHDAVDLFTKGFKERAHAPHTMSWIFWTPGPVAKPLFQDDPAQAHFWLYELPVLLTLTSPTSRMVIVNADSIFENSEAHCECPHWCHGALEYLEDSDLLPFWNGLHKSISYLSMPQMLQMMPKQPFLAREEVPGWYEAIKNANKENKPKEVDGGPTKSDDAHSHHNNDNGHHQGSHTNHNDRHGHHNDGHVHHHDGHPHHHEHGARGYN